MYIRIYTHCEATKSWLIYWFNAQLTWKHVRTGRRLIGEVVQIKRGIGFILPSWYFRNQSAKDEERYSKIFLPTSVKVESTPASEENYNFIINIPVCFCLFVTIAWWKMMKKCILRWVHFVETMDSWFTHVPRQQGPIDESQVLYLRTRFLPRRSHEDSNYFCFSM